MCVRARAWKLPSLAVSQGVFQWGNSWCPGGAAGAESQRVVPVRFHDSSRSGRRNTKRGARNRWRTIVGDVCGLMAFTADCVQRTPNCAAWWSLLSMNKEKNNFWQLRMALASRCRVGGTFCSNSEKESLNDPQLAIGDGALGF